MIYISGPMTGLPGFNYPAFNSHARRLRSKGLRVINPVEVCQHLPEGSDWAEYMALCIPAMIDCKKIFLLKGWEKSRGAKIELMHALKKGMEVEVEN